VQYELLRCLRVVRCLIALIRHHVPLYIAVNIRHQSNATAKSPVAHILHRYIPNEPSLTSHS
jgi:hypothetical protein